jgi:hypothetical protein
MESKKRTNCKTVKGIQKPSELFNPKPTQPSYSKSPNLFRNYKIAENNKLTSVNLKSWSNNLNKMEKDAKRFRISSDDRYRIAKQQALVNGSGGEEQCAFKEIEGINKRNSELIEMFKAKYC